MAPQVDRRLADESSFRRAHSRLGRQMRRLKKQGITQHNYSGEDSSVIRRLYENKRQYFTSGEENIFLDQRRCEFMVAVAALEGAYCDLFTLEDDAGQIIAGLLTFREHNVRRFYTIYFHPQWAHYSPGLALLYEVTARSLAEGLDCDYMTGEYPYKLRLSNASRPLFRLELEAEEFKRTAERLPASTAA
jgi:CelD/BcsL family acetyltransferase involved in cellulose biosynthesis